MAESPNGKLYTNLYTNRKVLRAATVGFNQRARNRWQKVVMENYIQNYIQTGKYYEPPLWFLMSERETDGSKESRNEKLYIKLHTNRKVLRAATVVLMSERETDGSKESRNEKLYTKLHTNRKVLRAATVVFNERVRNRWQ